MNELIGRPQPGDYAPYYDRYISEVVGENILEILEKQRRDTLLLLSGRNDADGDFRYAPDKWSVKQVMGHVCDTERVFAYRALRISRNDQTPLAGYEQDDYVKYGPFLTLKMEDLVEEFIAVRRATISLFRTMNPEGWDRRGVANNNSVTVRAIAWIIAGHELHHRRILESRYFAKAA